MYLPGASPASEKLPSASEVAVLEAPAASVAETVAPTMTPPNSSESCPRREPVVVACRADAIPAHSAKMSRRPNARPVTLRGNFMIQCPLTIKDEGGRMKDEGKAFF